MLLDLRHVRDHDRDNGGVDDDYGDAVHHGDDGHDNVANDIDGDGIMIPMTISVTRVKAGGMPSEHMHAGISGVSMLVHADVHLHVPAINCGVVWTIPGPGRIERASLGRNFLCAARALVMLDPG